MKKSILLTARLPALLFFQSCDDDFVGREQNTANYRQLNDSIQNLRLNDQDKLKLEFGRAFALALKDKQELRAIIKEEALKKFNKDYDVMYHLVKNRTLGSSNHTVRSLLVNYFEDENQLIKIENQLPLLTIFVPELPEDSFSAEKWDTSDPDQTPVVGIRLDGINEVPMIDAVNDYEYLLEADLIPGYPVVVIKNNERLVVNTGNHNFLNSTDILDAGGGLTYMFLDNNFNNAMTPAVLTQYLDDPIGGSGNGGNPCNPSFAYVPGRQNNVAQFLKDAYNVFDGIVTQAWQRDNIYYGLTPTQNEGAFKGGKYEESITYFRLQGNNPQGVFHLMSNTSNPANPDPQLTNQDWENNKRVPWTDGYFEIGINIVDNSKTRNVVNTSSGFSAKPSELFTYTHISKTVWRGFWPIRWKRTYYKPIINGYKGIDFTSTNLDATKLNIHEWDLTDYSNTWHYEFVEIDYTTETTSATSESRKYNTNIQIDTSIPLGDKVKLGLKFGASSEETQTTSRSMKWTEGNASLGKFDVSFWDNVLNKSSCNNQLYPRLYQNQYCMIEIRPVQVQN